MSYPQPIDAPPPPAPAWPRPWLWIGAVALALVTGAGGALALSNRSAGTPSGQAATPVQQPAAAVTAAPAATPAASPTAARTLKLGQEHSFTAADGAKVAVTALKRQADGDNYGVQVRTCNRGATEFTATPYPWMLSYSGGEELSEDQWTGGGLLSPAFTEGLLEPGKCRKGWLNFTRAGDPDGVEYRSRNDAKVRWEF